MSTKQPDSELTPENDEVTRILWYHREGILKGGITYKNNTLNARQALESHYTNKLKKALGEIETDGDTSRNAEQRRLGRNQLRTEILAKWEGSK